MYSMDRIDKKLISFSIIMGLFLLTGCNKVEQESIVHDVEINLEDYESSYDIIQGEIFDKYCISCHVAGHTYAEESGLILTSDVSYQSLINEYPKKSFRYRRWIVSC